MASDQSPSILSELKELAAQAKEDDLSQSLKAQNTPKASAPVNTSSSKFRLSDALADVHGAVDEEARAEQRRREQQEEFERTSREAQESAERQQRQDEAERRLTSEADRQRSLEHAKNLKQVIAEYEAALTRGDEVELPTELQASAPAPSPFEVSSEPRVVTAPAPKQSLAMPLVISGVVAALIIGALYALVFIPTVDELTQQKAALQSERDTARDQKMNAERELEMFKGLKVAVDDNLKSCNEDLMKAKTSLQEQAEAPTKSRSRSGRAKKKSRQRIKIKLGGN